MLKALVGCKAAMKEAGETQDTISDSSFALMKSFSDALRLRTVKLCEWMEKASPVCKAPGKAAALLCPGAVL